MSPKRKLVALVLALVVLANLAVLGWRLTASRRPQLVGSTKILNYENQWERYSSEVSVAIAPLAECPSEFSLALRPSLGAKHRYVTTIDFAGSAMRGVVLGSLSVRPSQANEIAIVNEVEKEWVVGSGGLIEVPTKSESLLTVQNGLAANADGTVAAAYQLFGESFVPGLDSLPEDAGHGKVGTKWTGANSEGNSTTHEVTGFATIAGWKTVVVESTRSSDKPRVDVSKSDGSVPASSSNSATARVRQMLAKCSATENSKFYLDLATGLTVRRETELTLKNARKSLKLKLVSQLFAEEKS